MQIDWKKIKSEYLRGGTSYRKLAKKYGVSFSVLQRRATRENWTDLRSQAQIKSDSKIIESVASQEARRVDGIQAIADLLQTKILEGIEDGRFIMDASSTRQIISALKDLRDIKGCKSELDMQEQLARIEKLRKEAKDDTQVNKEIKVVIDSGLEEFSK